MDLFTQVLVANLVSVLLALAVVFMIVRSCLGHAADFRGKAGSLAGKELEKDWFLISQQKNAHHMQLRLCNLVRDLQK